MKYLKPVSKSLINFSIFQLSLIFFIVLFIPIYTYFGTNFINKVCLFEQCYLLPKHWIIETQIDHHQQTFLGIKSFSRTNNNIENLVRLRSNFSGASINKVDYNFKNKKFLKKIGYSEVVSGNCKYWKHKNIDHDMNKFIFEQNRLQLNVWEADFSTIEFFKNSFCNPIKR